MAYKIYGRPDEPHLNISVDGWDVFGMTLQDVKPEAHEWLAQHLDERFQQASERAAAKAVREHQAKLRGLLGVV